MLDKKQITDIKKNIIEAQSAEDERFPVIFNALSDRGRFRIFRLLTERCDICVTDIANIFRISVPAASQQLRVLEMTGLVKKERVGQTICYEVRTEDFIVRSLMKALSGKSATVKVVDAKNRELVKIDREKVIV